MIPSGGDEKPSRGLNICKACEPCRRRKIRCNGAQPCFQPQCRENPSQCSYRQRIRVRKPKRSMRAESEVEARNKKSSAVAGDSKDHHHHHHIRDHPRPLADSAGGGGGGGGGGRPDADAEDPPDRLTAEKAAAAAAAAEEDGQTSNELCPHASIVAAHLAPQSTDSSQLFYGPSSNFAFLQQIHRGILSRSRSRGRDGEAAEESGGGVSDRSGLDAFMQRAIFFGTPSRVNPDMPLPLFSQIPQNISREQASAFIGWFHTSTLHSHPFFTVAELDTYIQQIYSGYAEQTIPPQTRALVLAMMAIGALGMATTTLAEMLFTMAKREAIFYDEAVTVPMIQFSMLLAAYQINIARPNSGYLHLGTACRKAFALGLHRENNVIPISESEQQKRRATIWSLYFHETWLALTLGRKGALKVADISCPLPDNEPHLSNYCQLARIFEDGADMMYSRRTDSLRQLYATAELIHGRLTRFAEHVKIDASDTLDPGRLQLHFLYYHAVLLTFRPFLVASAASRAATGKTEEMWLRQACRHATDAAQDLIVFMSNNFTNSKGKCKGIRYAAFFLECSCAVLLHDSLWCPSKHPYNLEFIQMALRCTELMADDEPVSIVRDSLRQTLKAVERSIGRAASSNASTPAGQSANAMIQFPSLGRNNQSTAAADQLIYLTDRPDQDMVLENGHSHGQAVDGSAGPNGSGGAGASAGADRDRDRDRDRDMYSLNFDVLTADLFNFFPLDSSGYVPSNTVVPDVVDRVQ